MKNMNKDNRRRFLAALMAVCMIVSLAAGISALSGRELQQTRAEGSTAVNAVLTTDAEGSITDTELTSTGSTLSGWNYDTSRFLHVNFNGDTTDKDYRIVIEMAPQLYANISAVPDVPSGFASVDYMENEALAANEGTTAYIHSYSGTYEYAIMQGTSTAGLSLELRYDNAFWNMKEGAALNQGTDPLLKVYLVEVTTDGEGNETRTEVTGCTSSLQQAAAGVARETAPTVALFREGDVRNYTLNGTLEGFESSQRAIAVLQSMHNLGYSDGYYFDRLTVEITRPSVVVDGTTYYMEVDDVIVRSSNSDISLTTQTEDTGTVTCSMEDVYCSGYYGISRGLVEVYFKFPTNLTGGKAVEKYTFANGAVCVTGMQNGVETDVSGGDCNNYNWNKIGFAYEDDPAPDVRLRTGEEGKATVSGSNLKWMQLGALYNLGGDSGKVTFRLEFDTDNFNAIHVTNINVMASTGPKEGEEEDGVDYAKIPVTYTLMDADGNLVENGKTYTLYLDNPYYGKEAVKNMNVKLKRIHLPEEQREYFFKTVEYPIYSIKRGIYLVDQNQSAGMNSGGNYYAYTNVDAETIVQTKATCTDVDGTVIFDRYLRTRIMDEARSPYQILNATVSSSSINAGEALNISGTVAVNSYPYTYQQYMEKIRIGIVLPEGVEINRQSIRWYLENDRTKRAAVESISREPLADGTGKSLWTIVFDSSVVIGWYNEALTSIDGTGHYLQFSMQLNTDPSMAGQTIDLTTDLYTAGEGQINGASGGTVQYLRADIYDLNNNGSTTDNVGGTAEYLPKGFTEIRALSAALSIRDSLRTEEAGSSKVSLTDAGQALYYDLSIRAEAGGNATNFFHFIPIPKADSQVQSNFILSNQLELDMTGPVEITENMDENPLQVWYTTDAVTYAQAAAEEKDSEAGTINWFTELPEDKTWSDVTMIRLKYMNASINNGSRSALSVPLICDINEDDFTESAGMQSSFKSRGYHSYIRNNMVRFEGEFSTAGVTAELVYTVEDKEITLTAAKDETPTQGGVKSQVLSGFPEFTVAKTYSITSVEPHNVDLVSSAYIQSHADSLSSSEANRKFAIEVCCGDGTPSDILSGDAILLGTEEAGTAPTFTFTLHNADALSDITTERYVDIIITGENGVTIPVRINIAREFSMLVVDDSSIEAGKRYPLTLSAVKEVSVSRDSAYTAQFVFNDVIPKEVTERRLSFGKTPAEGTTVLMIDWTVPTAPIYARYVVSGTGAGAEAAYEVSLRQFTLLGGNGSYAPDTVSDTQTKEQRVFVVDHSGCTVMEAARDNSISLEYDQNGTTVTDTLEYTTTAERSFSVAADPQEVTLGSSFEVDYTSVLGGEGFDSRFAGRRFALVITSAEGEDALPADAQLEAEGSLYSLNTEGRFIVPVGNVQDGSGSVNLKLTAESVSDKGEGISLDIELWSSATANGVKPMQGEKVAETAMTQKGPVMPSLRIDDLVSRVMKVSDLKTAAVLKFSKLELEGTSVTLEVQQKIGSGYMTLANKVEAVDGEFNHASGVFTIDMSKQNDNMLNLKLAEDLTAGTYRVLMKVYDASGTERLYVPYNFIIQADETTDITE